MYEIEWAETESEKPKPKRIRGLSVSETLLEGGFQPHSYTLWPNNRTFVCAYKLCPSDGFYPPVGREATNAEVRRHRLSHSIHTNRPSHE